MKMLAVAVAAAVSLSGFLVTEVSTSYYEYPLNPSVQGHKKHTSHRQIIAKSNFGSCDDYIKNWNDWGSGFSAKLVAKEENEETIDSWKITFELDQEVKQLDSWEAVVEKAAGSNKKFAVTNNAWNGPTAADTERAVSIQGTYDPKQTAPKLRYITLANGNQVVCGASRPLPQTPEVTEVTESDEGVAQDEEEPEAVDATPVTPTPTQEPISQSKPGDRGVFVQWPKRVMGLYILLADDSECKTESACFDSTAEWDPQLYEWQQEGSNVLFFTFIHPGTMDVPPAFEKLARSRGSGKPGAVPKDTVIMFAIGGYAYSIKPNPWHWLESKEAAEKMAEKVAKWPELYGIDGIDLDLEEGAGAHRKAGMNMVHFIKKLRTLAPKLIVSQPVYGYPQVEAESYVINESWDVDGNNKGVADSIGLMVYEGTQALNYVKNYNRGGDQWEGFPIKVNAPSNTILLGAKGSSTYGTIETLAKAAVDKDLLGIMVWYSSVKNGFQYAVTWDAQGSESSQKGYNRAMEIFKSENAKFKSTYSITPYNDISGEDEDDMNNKKHHSVGYVLGKRPWNDW